MEPKAATIPHIHEKHNHKREDMYQWMTQRDAPEVISYLEEENAYYDHVTLHTNQLKENLFHEIKNRITEDDQSVPYKYNGYWYITRMKKDHDYPFYFRRKESLDAPDELLFDVNQMAIGHDFYKLSGVSVAPNNEFASYAIDITGRRQYTIYFKNLKTNQTLPFYIDHTTGSCVWSQDNKYVFFVRKDQQTLRASQIYRYEIGTHPDQAVLVYEEKDDVYNTYVYKSKSEAYIMIKSSSTLTDEIRFISSSNPTSEFKILQKREKGLEYSAMHYANCFYIITNKDQAVNFKVMKTSVDQTQQDYWEDVIAHDDKVLIEDVDIFNDYLVISDRYNGLNRIRIKSWDGSQDYFLPFDNETYTVFTTTNVDFDSNCLRYAYNSLTTPASICEYDFKTKKTTVLKQHKVEDPSFNVEHYASERVWATASDGVKIPISLVYRKDKKSDTGNPLLLYGYGSYGSTIDPYFSTARLSLLDRGFIYAIAHIRGGEYLGRQWYEDGKMFHKINTFTDFIACSRYLIDQQYTSAQQLYASGGSAGGLLIGAVINMAPQLYHGVISAVPFVDVVTTMLDDSIPLTTGEYDEWGNPNHEDSYRYMLSYSPYDQVQEQDYPNILVTTGYHDSQVQYWEPAKWVAKLRTHKTDDNLVLFKTDMKSGHSGASGRYDALKEVAIDYAFLLDLEGIKE